MARRDGLSFSRLLPHISKSSGCSLTSVGSSVDPDVCMAGDALMGLLWKAGAAGPAAALCREIAAQYPEAAWAHVQLGLLLLGQGYAEEAVRALQVCLVEFLGALEVESSNLSGHGGDISASSFV